MMTTKYVSQRNDKQALETAKRTRPKTPYNPFTLPTFDFPTDSTQPEGSDYSFSFACCIYFTTFFSELCSGIWKLKPWSQKKSAKNATNKNFPMPFYETKYISLNEVPAPQAHHTDEQLEQIRMMRNQKKFLESLPGGTTILVIPPEPGRKPIATLYGSGKTEDDKDGEKTNSVLMVIPPKAVTALEQMTIDKACEELEEDKKEWAKFMAERKRKKDENGSENGRPIFMLKTPPSAAVAAAAAASATETEAEPPVRENSKDRVCKTSIFRFFRRSDNSKPKEGSK